MVDGVLHFPSDTQVQARMMVQPLSDGEVTGERDAEFTGEISEVAEDGSFVAQGTLAGRFGIDENEELEVPAVVEVFAKQGSIGFVQLTVERSDGGVTFAANLRPSRDADKDNAIRGLAFIGHPEATRA